MWSFKRSNKAVDRPAVPEEIQEYYQAQKRERIGVAWLLALATFAVVVAGVLGLFFVGKWAFHALKKDKVANVSTTSQTSTASSNTGDYNPSSTSPSNTPSTSTPSTSAPAPAASAPSTTTQPSTPTPAATTPKLTNTGPGDIVEIFAVTTTAAGAAHHIATTRRRNS